VCRQSAIEAVAGLRYTRRLVALRSPGNIGGGSVMPLKSSTGEAANSAANSLATVAVAPDDLAALGRWLPKKEMALLVEICERARGDPDLLRPALLLSLAYAESVARMLDQDPIPTVTRRIRDGLQQLREKSGL
jgi:hypothetical protein